MRHVKWVSIRRASHASLPSTQRRPPLPCCAISIWGQALRIALLAIVPGTSPLVASGQTRPGKAADAGEVVYRMQPGDSPWSISETLLSDMAFWPRIVQRNGFGSRAAQLPPGTLVRIPQAWLRRRDVPATVLAVVDDVVIAAVDGTRRAAEPGASLLVGERLSTSNIGSATLELHDGSRVLVRPSTDVELGTSNLPIALDPETGASLESGPAPASGSMLAVQLRLLRGALENAVQQIGPAGRFEIETPAAVAAVRGTRLRLSVQDDAVNAELPQGAAQLKNAQAGRGLDAGEGTRTVAGRPPEPPSLLLPAPDLAALPDEITRLPIELPFALTPDATGYRTQLATLDTDALVSDRLTRGPRLSVREPPNGDYRLRVRAVDPRGLEGFDVERIVRVHVRPTPPLLIAPAPDGRSADERPLYRWSQAVSTAQGQPVRNVRLQVAADPSFATPLLDLSLPDAGEAQPAQTLGIGRWHWRLHAIDSALGAGPWSDAQSFTRILPAPDVPPPDVNSDGLTLRWPKVPGAVSYRVQLAGRSNFEQALLDTTLDAERLRLDRPAPGDYFLRVQAITADGESGAFSAPEQFRVEERVNYWNLLWLLAPLLLAF